MELTPTVSAMRGRRAALASPTRLNAAATRRSAAITSGRRSRSSDGKPAGTSPGNVGNSAPVSSVRRRVAAHDDLERAIGLVARQFQPPHRVAIGAGVGPRDGRVQVVADAHAEPRVGEPHQFARRSRAVPSATASCSRASTARIQHLATVAAMACCANLKSASVDGAPAAAAALP